MHDVSSNNTLVPHGVKFSCFGLKLLLDFFLSWELLLYKLSFLSKAFALLDLGVVSINFLNFLVDLEHSRVVLAVLFERSVAQLVA